MKYNYFFLLWCCFLPYNTKAQTWIFTNINVVPMSADTIWSGMDVWVENGKIVSIEKTGISKPPPAKIINGEGKYLLPGLIDMHVHFFHEQGVDKALLPDEVFVMLANGITTARVMAGSRYYLDLRDDIHDDLLPGPRLFVASPPLVGNDKYPGTLLTNEKDARKAVKKAVEEGYDAIKITFSITADVYQAIIREARRQNVMVCGHVGPDVKLPAALEAGQQVEHLDEFLEMLLPDSSFNHGISVSGTSIWNKTNAWPTLDKLDEHKIPALVEAVKQSGIYVTPTNFFLHTAFAYGLSREEMMKRPDYLFIPQSLKAEREKTYQYYWADPPAERLRKKYVALRYEITKALWKAGVPLMAGSDSPEWYLVPGFSLHDELKEFVKAGLSPFAALQTATVNPAKCLDIASSTGTISVGKYADLLLLSANPLENIEHTTFIEGVMIDGVWYPVVAIAQQMEAIQGKMKNF